MTPAAVAGAGAASVLSVEGLCIAAREGAALLPLVADLSFAVGPGETLAVAGESGSGKSITALALMGLLPEGVAVTAGRAALDGTDLLALPERRLRAIRGDRIAMIFQEPMTSLNPVMRVGAQLVEAIRAHAAERPAAARARALEALRQVRIPEAERRLGQYPHELSGGMRQRVMIAMALALRPALLIADEPTTALDVTVQREVLDLLRDLQRETGTALVLITHDMGVVAEMADRVVVMRAGRMVEEGAVGRIFAAPARPYTRELLAAVPRLGGPRIGGPRIGGPRIGVSRIGGPGLGADRHAGHDHARPPAARLVGASVTYDVAGGFLGRPTHRVHAVHEVSLEIRAGETLALVGESGCGKSTVARALTGLVPHGGHVEVAGRALAGLAAAERRALCREVQMVFQDPMAALDPRMRVGEAVAEPLSIHGVGTRASRRARAATLFGRVGLAPDHLDRYPHEFSGGQRQRICIARALALDPRLIVLDESVSALDVSVQARVLALLAELQRELGMAYLFISHDMAVVEAMADRVAVMQLGQIVETGTRAQVFGSPRHPYTRALLDAVPVPDPVQRRGPRLRLAAEPGSPVHPLGRGPVTVRLEDAGGGHLVAAR